MNKDKMKLVISPKVAEKLKDKRMYSTFCEEFKKTFVGDYNHYEMCFNGVAGFMSYYISQLTNQVSIINNSHWYEIGFCYQVQGYKEVLITHVDIEEVEDYGTY